MALSALCDDGEWGSTWRDVLQHRFRSSGSLNEHAVGNLLIVSLWELLGDPVAGLDWVGRLLGARGRVLPMAQVPMRIEADVAGVDPERPDEVTVVRGQVEVASTPGRVVAVRLLPADAPACPEATQAVREADWVVLGPGSWFTSVAPHLLVPELAASLVETSARRCVVLNLEGGAGETAGLSAADHVRVLAAHAPGLKLDAVVADPGSVDDVDDLSAAVAEAGGQLLLRQVGLGDGTPRHDPVRLAAALRDVFDGALGDLHR